MMFIRAVKKFIRNKPELHTFIRIAYRSITIARESVASLAFHLFPIKKNKIVIINYNGKGYGDNGKYIVEEILRNNYEYDIVWLIKDKLKEISGTPSKVRTVRYGSIKSIYELTTAKLWINNCRNKLFLLKRKEQYYIQTWHGGLGLKKIEADTALELSKDYIYYAKRDSRQADLFISNSAHLTNIYKKSFWYSGSILESGYPKNDILFSKKSAFRNKIREAYAIEHHSKILLYAPTFRQNHDISPYDIDMQSLLSFLNQGTDQWVIMARLHPNLDDTVFFDLFPETVINASSFPDMQELVLGTDALVTDYSSCMFDSAVARIPTFLYASDISDYMKDRGFYFTMDELPFNVAENTHDLIANISSFNEKDYLSELQNFYTKVGLYDKGDASKEVVSRIHSLLQDSQPR